MRKAQLAKLRQVEKVMLFPNGHTYCACPRSNIMLGREFVVYCDRSGQHLGWRGYKKAGFLYSGNRKEAHT